MTRLRQVPRSEVTDEHVEAIYALRFGTRDPVAEPGTATGTPGNWWTVFALVPDALRHATDGFAFTRSEKRLIPPDLRELGQTRAGWLCGSQFVFSQRCKASRLVGITNDKIDAIPHWQISNVFSPLERALLAYTDALVSEHGRVDDAVFDALREGLSDEAILEFTYATAMFMLHATISRALKLEYDDVPDPVVEIAAPLKVDSMKDVGE